jgi:hypothetical protein
MREDPHDITAGIDPTTSSSEAFALPHRENAAVYLLCAKKYELDVNIKLRHKG